MYNSHGKVMNAKCHGPQTENDKHLCCKCHRPQTEMTNYPVANATGLRKTQTPLLQMPPALGKHKLPCCKCHRPQENTNYLVANATGLRKTQTLVANATSLRKTNTPVANVTVLRKTQTPLLQMPPALGEHKHPCCKCHRPPTENDKLLHRPYFQSVINSRSVLGKKHQVTWQFVLVVHPTGPLRCKFNESFSDIVSKGCIFVCLMGAQIACVCVRVHV